MLQKVEIKERPILFSAPMIRAILEGRKTQTRRIVKSLRVFATPETRAYTLKGSDAQRAMLEARNFKNLRSVFDDAWEWTAKAFPHQAPAERTTWLAHAPYAAGMRLWVRETWTSGIPGIWTIDDARRNPGQIYYKADGGTGPWWPSIHMPREFSRILLKITNVRVEHLQDISDEDAKAEGMIFTDYGLRCFHDLGDGSPPRKYDPSICCAPIEHHQQLPGWSWGPTQSHEECLTSAKWAFANLWCHINGEDSWAKNPWVWAISFQRVNPSC